MKLLIAEDAEYKLNTIMHFIENEYKEIEIHVTNSYSSAIKSLVSNNFDLAILDMSLPTFDKVDGDEGGEFRTYGGLDIARQIKRRSLLVKFLFLTQYRSFIGDPKLQNSKSIDEKARSLYPEQYLGLIPYENNENLWKEELGRLIEGLSDG